jgi:DNA-binding response OmpR family regulator
MAANILIAEDDPNILNLLYVFLSGRGYNVFTAVNGEEALHLLKEVQPDLLITDVMMPERNGYQLVRDLTTEHHDIKTPKILMLTSRMDPNDVQTGLNVGADMYVTKPFDMNELAERVKELLSSADAGSGGAGLPEQSA